MNYFFNFINREKNIDINNKILKTKNILQQY